MHKTPGQILYEQLGACEKLNARTCARLDQDLAWEPWHGLPSAIHAYYARVASEFLKEIGAAAQPREAA